MYVIQCVCVCQGTGYTWMRDFWCAQLNRTLPGIQVDVTTVFQITVLPDVFWTSYLKSSVDHRKATHTQYGSNLLITHSILYV